MQKQLTGFNSIDGLYVDGTFKSAPKFFHQLFTIHGLTMCNLHFCYRPINIQRPTKMYQPYGIRCCRTRCECFTNNCLCWLRNRHSQNSDNSVARLESLSMSFPFRTELVAENAIFGTQQAEWEERLWGKSVLEENIQTVAFTSDGSLRLLCVGNFYPIFRTTSEWNSFATTC